ncbi:hypothetical protein EAI_07627 [Harpegnathos saltator]|uniref:Uncharacterized protein n=1 Tax=Harpegnathos saltator TaxID=610380 RepID=E2BWF4_HARSA|nr:hypothetical protein EAI_06325 [Harpegnathos saltator]EFN79975.1 hypothetical protein EAI_07627 [Harpegnathos saltator]
MCLAIAMYVITGALSLIRRVLSTIGSFLLIVLARIILLVGRIVSKDISRRRATSESLELYTDSEDDHGITSETSLELKNLPQNSPSN